MCNLLTQWSREAGMRLCSQMRLWHMHEPVAYPKPTPPSTYSPPPLPLNQFHSQTPLHISTAATPFSTVFHPPNQFHFWIFVTLTAFSTLRFWPGSLLVALPSTCLDSMTDSKLQYSEMAPPSSPPEYPPGSVCPNPAVKSEELSPVNLIFDKNPSICWLFPQSPKEYYALMYA